MNKPLNTVKVLFADSKYNYSTNVSSQSTEETAKDYFIGKYIILIITPDKWQRKP